MSFLDILLIVCSLILYGINPFRHEVITIDVVKVCVLFVDLIIALPVVVLQFAAVFVTNVVITGAIIFNG